MGLALIIKRLFRKNDTDDSTSTPDKSGREAVDGKKTHTFTDRDVLCKFVLLDNNRIGETISTDSGHLIFKQDAKNLYIPLSSVKEITDENVVVETFDRDEAVKLGKEWQDRTTDTLIFDENGMLIND
ncbi:MAG: hypothetical protein C5S46_04380 [Candidatus Methanomarinus sp.]|jgi:hypothetical protein|uniref:Uncharacterized protein n=1 Tax=Candidatus Methanomarinus sp. TaxID=3386244 RepID=A0AC61SAG0_9EURY|nr:hypothetical protein C5S42_04325 [ANME-2 cluster archaeon]PPA79340.1 MAG: hypothetical protein C00003105_01539 [ANME-2 cluster archaeon HR1]TKY91713.1 MAG: hypothetical protein C5S46_04380 [ANME-2 cluster archaeon]